MFSQILRTKLTLLFAILIAFVSFSSLIAQPVGNPASTGKPEGPANTEEEFEQRYRERITKDRLHGVYIPKNLDDALAQLDKNISAESKEKIKQLPEDEVVSTLHDRLGRWMMNNWCFYEGSRFSHYLRSAGVTYPDDMADFMIMAYHKHLNGQKPDIRELAKNFREMRKAAFEAEKKRGKVVEEIVKPAPGTATPKGSSPAPPPVKPAPAKPSPVKKG